MNTFTQLLAQTTITNTELVNAAGGIALGMIFLFIILFAVAITCAVFWVIALIHLLKHEDIKDRTLWIVLLIVLNGIVGPIYYFAVKKPYDREHSAPTQVNQ